MAERVIACERSALGICGLDDKLRSDLSEQSINEPRECERSDCLSGGGAGAKLHQGGGQARNLSTDPQRDRSRPGRTVGCQAAESHDPKRHTNSGWRAAVPED